MSEFNLEEALTTFITTPLYRALRAYDLQDGVDRSAGFRQPLASDNPLALYHQEFEKGLIAGIEMDTVQLLLDKTVADRKEREAKNAEQEQTKSRID